MKEQDKSIYYLTDEELNKIDFSKITPESELLKNELLFFEVPELPKIETTQKDG